MTGRTVRAEPLPTAAAIWRNRAASDLAWAAHWRRRGQFDWARGAVLNAGAARRDADKCFAHRGRGVLP